MKTYSEIAQDIECARAALDNGATLLRVDWLLGVVDAMAKRASAFESAVVLGLIQAVSEKKPLDCGKARLILEAMADDNPDLAAWLKDNPEEPE